MHYKKAQISDGGVFDGLRGQLGHGNFNVPSASTSSDILFTELEQLSGSKLSQFSRSLSATFGAKPWKIRKAKPEGGFLGISASGIEDSFIKSSEFYIKQVLRSQIGGDSSLRSSSGSSSQGQALADFAQLLSRSISRNM